MMVPRNNFTDGYTGTGPADDSGNDSYNSEKRHDDEFGKSDIPRGWEEGTGGLGSVVDSDGEKFPGEWIG